MEENLHDVASHAPRVVASIFAFDVVTLYLTENDTAYSSDPRRSFISPEQSLRAAAVTRWSRSRRATAYASFPGTGDARKADRSP